MRVIAAGLLAGALVMGAAQAQDKVKLDAVSAPRDKRQRAAGFRADGQIHGYLVTPAGQGLRGMVTLATREGLKLSYHYSHAQSRGRFEIDGLQPGRYQLRVDTLGLELGDLLPPEPIEVEVRSRQVTRPRLVARAVRRPKFAFPENLIEERKF